MRREPQGATSGRRRRLIFRRLLTAARGAGGCEPIARNDLSRPRRAGTMPPGKRLWALRRSVRSRDVDHFVHHADQPGCGAKPSATGARKAFARRCHAVTCIVEQAQLLRSPCSVKDSRVAHRRTLSRVPSTISGERSGAICTPWRSDSQAQLAGAGAVARRKAPPKLCQGLRRRP